MRRRVSSGARRREPEPPTYDAAAIQALFDTWADDVEGGAMGMDGASPRAGVVRRRAPVPTRGTRSGPRETIDRRAIP